jgi:glycosyltransferase involved in cell wall biosynthesis
MRILLITHFFPPRYNAGTENYTLGLAQALAKESCQVHVVCADHWETGPKYWNGVVTEEYKGVRVSRIHLNWKKASDPNRVLYDSPVVKEWFDGFLKTKHFDVAHVVSTYTLGMGILQSIRDANIPLVLSLMDFWFICSRTVLLKGTGELCSGIVTPDECSQCLLTSSHFWNTTRSTLPKEIHGPLWEKIQRTPGLARLPGARGLAQNTSERMQLSIAALKLPQAILSHSHFVQEMFRLTGYSNRVIYLPNGHDLSWLEHYKGNSPSKVLRYGYLGQIQSAKGVHLAIDAFLKSGMGENARLDIWGNPDQSPAYSARLRDMIGTHEMVRLRGRFQHANLAQVLEDIDVLLVPSVWYENMPLVIQEAFAAKIPVIASRLGGMAEAVTHEQNGLLFESGNATSLGAAMSRFIEEPDLIERLRKGIPVVKTIEAEVKELKALYDRVGRLDDLKDFLPQSMEKPTLDTLPPEMTS